MENFVTCEKIDGVNILKFIFNEINFEQREKIKKKLNEFLLNGEGMFIIDISRVGFLSSLVITTIVFFSKIVREQHGEVKISGLSSQAFSVFRLTQLDKVFELFRNNREALESFKTA